MNSRHIGTAILALALVISLTTLPLSFAPAETQPDSTTPDNTSTPATPHPENPQSQNDSNVTWPQTFGSENTSEDPENDTLGWEDGYWYDDPLPSVDTTDGINETELEKITARSKARVEHLRGIEFDNTTTVTVISRTEFKQTYFHNSTHSQNFSDFDNTKFEAMFVIGENNDSLAVQSTTSGSSIGGFYDPNTNRIVLVSDSNETLTVDEGTLIHELTHAAQDQKFGLNNHSAPTRDAYNARNGLVEGDANYIQTRYEQHCQQNWDCITPDEHQHATIPDGFNWGVYLLKFFPYSDGPVFINELGERGGWDAVNNAYSNPPTTSSEIIHPDTYPRETTPLPNQPDRSSSRWTRVTVEDRPNYASVGESGLFTMFATTAFDDTHKGSILGQPLYAHSHSAFDVYNYNHPATNGYVDDKLYTYRNTSSGELAYSWTIKFQTTSGAQTFTDTYRTLLDYYGADSIRASNSIYTIDNSSYADAYYISQSENTVTIVNAPTVDALPDVNPDATPDGNTKHITEYPHP